MHMSSPERDAHSRADVLDVGSLSVVLGGIPVLRGIDLNVRAGEFVALLGANGSGKSTLVKAALGLLPAERGEVDLFGAPVRSFHDWKRVGYVPQRSTVAMQQASVREVVASGWLSRQRPFVPAGRRARVRVDEALASVGLSDRASLAMTTLSGGQQQRALVARALVAEPELLVMDEPLAGVDHANQQAIADIVGSTVARGAAALVVLHELGPFAPLIDRAVVLVDGRVALDGPPGELPGLGGHEHDHREAPSWFPDTFDGGTHDRNSFERRSS